MSETVRQIANRVFREHRRYTGDGLPGEPTSAPLPVGDPQSGQHNPPKRELRDGLGDVGDAVEAARDAALAAPPFDPELANWTQSGTGAATTTVDRELRNRAINVFQFMSEGLQTKIVLRTSTAADGAEINSAMNAALTEARAKRKALYCPGGLYFSAEDGRFTNPGVHVFGDGPGNTLFRKVKQNSLFQTLGTMPDKDAGFALAANASAGVDEITLATGLGASVVEGEIYILLDESAIYTGNTGKKGEFVGVREVDGDTIKLWRYTKFSYATASTAKLVPVTFVEGVGYSDFSIQWDTTSTVTSSNSFQELFPIDIRWSILPKVSNVEIINSLHAGVFLHGCYHAQIRGYTGRDFGSNTTGTDDPASVDGLPGFGYGIREDSLNEGLVASDLHFTRCRVGYDTIAGYSAIFNHGEPTGSVVANGIHVEPRGSGWGTHWPGDGITFANLTTIGGRRNAITARSRRMKVINPVAIRCRGPAVWIRGGEGGDPSLRGDYCVVENVMAAETNQGTDLYSSQDWRERGAVVDEGRHNTINGVTAVGTGGGILSIGNNGIARRNVYRNLTGRDICQLAATFPDAVRVVDANTDANLLIDGLLVHSSDGKVRHLVSRETAATFDDVPIEVTVDNVKGYGHSGSVVSSATNINGLRPASGTYTPAQVSTNTNITSITHVGAQYSRVGDVVTVSGQATVNPASAAAFSIRMSLPINSNLGSSFELAGYLRNASGSVEATIFADTANDCAFISGVATATGGTNSYYQFTYRVKS